jgi:hypothetical protein
VYRRDRSSACLLSVPRAFSVVSLACHEHGSRWLRRTWIECRRALDFDPRHLPTKSASFSMAAALQDIEDRISPRALCAFASTSDIWCESVPVDEDAIQAVGEAIASVPPLPQHLPSGGETFRTRISGPGMDSNEDSRLDSSHCGNSSRLQVECLNVLSRIREQLGWSSSILGIAIHDGTAITRTLIAQSRRFTSASECS